MFKLLSKTIGYINKTIATVGITLGVTIAFVNVIARYMFDASFTWATELTIYLFIWSFFFAAAYCFKKDAHIAVTIILDLMSPRIAKTMLIISHIVTILFLLAVAYYGYTYIMEIIIDLDERSIDLWDIPMWIPYSVIPISFLFSAYRVLERLIMIINTSHKEVLRESEADMILHGLGGDIEEKAEELDALVRDVNKKTGGML